MAAAAILDFQKFKFKFSAASTLERPILRNLDKFHQDRWIRCLDLLLGYLDHPLRVLGGLYHCAKIGWNRCTSFDNMQVLLLCVLGLKTPIHAPKLFLGLLAT